MSDYWDKFTVTERERSDLGGNCRHGDPRSVTPTLWNYLIDRFAPGSMLDVGAGEGHTAAFFHSRGVKAHAVEGSMTNVRRSRHPATLHDLTQAPYCFPCDLVWCVEVVEHIEERYVENVIDTLCNADVVAMTHAVPGQAGHHHVNCQPQEYWVEKMAANGYMLDPDNDVYRQLASLEFEDSYFALTGCVFLRPGAA